MRKAALAVAIMTITTGTAWAQTATAPVTTATDPEEGEYVVSGSGFALYTFKADVRGSANAPARSACEGECLDAWPPLLVSEPPVGDGNIRAELLGTIVRSDGTTQVTYNGWPLYFYAEDTQPSDIKGNDIEEFGEDWYLIGPNGNRSDRDDENARRNGRDDRDED